MADVSSIKLPNGTTYTVKDSAARNHIGNGSNPHRVTKSQVGLGNVANYDQSKAIKSITRSGTTFTATALDGTTFTFTQQDNNTTYSVATQKTNGLMSSADKTKLDSLSATSVSAITNSEIDSIAAS
nr:MAG TPA: Minor structural protein [Caudoviricetes sp.]